MLSSAAAWVTSASARNATRQTQPPQSQPYDCSNLSQGTSGQWSQVRPEHVEGQLLDECVMSSDALMPLRKTEKTACLTPCLSTCDRSVSKSVSTSVSNCSSEIASPSTSGHLSSRGAARNARGLRPDAAGNTSKVWSTCKDLMPRRIAAWQSPAS